MLSFYLEALHKLYILANYSFSSLFLSFYKNEGKEPLTRCTYLKSFLTEPQKDIVFTSNIRNSCMIFNNILLDNQRKLETFEIYTNSEYP